MKTKLTDFKLTSAIIHTSKAKHQSIKARCNRKYISFEAIVEKLTYDTLAAGLYIVT